MAGGRIIIASDGVWDDLTCEMALDCSRGFPSDVAANKLNRIVCLEYLLMLYLFIL